MAVCDSASLRAHINSARAYKERNHNVIVVGGTPARRRGDVIPNGHSPRLPGEDRKRVSSQKPREGSMDFVMVGGGIIMGSPVMSRPPRCRRGLLEFVARSRIIRNQPSTALL